MASRSKAPGRRGPDKRPGRVTLGNRSSGGAPGAPSRIAYLYVLPGFAAYAVFVLVPLFRSVELSFYRWGGVGAGEWIGFGNYREVLVDDVVRAGFLHAMILIIFYAVIPVTIGLFLAATLSRVRIRGLTFFRTVLFLPQVIAMVVVAVMWRWIYAPTGLLNQFLNGAGFESLTQAWLGSFALALPSLGLVGTWVMYGLAMVLFIAGVQKIPSELYDAARMDGAGPVREFFAVTLPGLRNEVAVASVLTVIQAFRNFDLVYLTTNGGPGTATTIPALQIFRNAFLIGRVGYAATIGVILALLLLLLTIVIERIAGSTV